RWASWLPERPYECDSVERLFGRAASGRPPFYAALARSQQCLVVRAKCQGQTFAASVIQGGLRLPRSHVPDRDSPLRIKGGQELAIPGECHRAEPNGLRGRCERKLFLAAADVPDLHGSR